MSDDNPFAPPTPASRPLPPPSAPTAPAGAAPGPDAGRPGHGGGEREQPTTRLPPLTTVQPVSPPGPGPVPPPPPPPPAERRSRGLGGGSLTLVATLALLAGLVGGIGGSAVMDAREDDARPADAALPEAVGSTPVERPEGSVAAIAADALPSVVSIAVRGAEGEATGSGMVLKADGYILTNNHVVADATASGAPVFVTFSDGHEKQAEIVGATPDYDLAVLKVDETGLTPLVLGDSDAVVVGDSVLAAGSPLGLDATVTTGIVSALHRPVQAGEQSATAFIDAIQTDAAINPGNSGGPLLNSAGEVIGINSAIAQAPGSLTATGNIGLGFAIPSNQARRTAEQLIESGEATFPVIGVLLDQTYQGEGVRVATTAQGGQPPVTPDGPADRAGIAPGDVILAIDGRPVSRSDELIVAIRALAPGDAVTLRVRPGGETEGEGREVRVVLDEKTSG
ncbi:S1C family serine protease [Myceligenerans pegani]|uniref:Trypsin-like peptidase domain-containing protein n=1 Tax=Myceligenerans pegani TaxID=2776917 RepID=A0ABR9N0B3_9MICO|nr:trypsin-like peptidase domain-containing protein [Myceligenerans sp. TRM 65318]MBE1877092.1 trypsin-like peptidase domain-containing protein [Myceligenerans sp. TRM 65318]MBE3019363.1 trypsin-like peptidase domain-containing protein [Myceligenerans sp. TRM 65318]